MSGSVLALAVAWTLGFLATDLCWPAAGRGRRFTPLKIWMGLGVGLGLVSLLQFAVLVLVGRASRAIVVPELIALAVAFAWHRRGSGKDAGAPAAPTVVTSAVGTIGLLVLAACALRLVYALGLNPHGSWDAFAFWNVRAKFLYELGAAWPAAFDPRLVHADYPLLLPGLVLRGWTYAGSEHLAVPIGYAIAFTAGAVGVVHGALRVAAGAPAAWLGTLVLLAPPFFVAHGASQTADVPLAFFILATVVLLMMHDAFGRGASRLLLLAGFAAGCAAWTKNEGALFFIAVAAGRGLAVTRSGGVGEAGRQLACAAAGALPALAALAYFKIALAPANDLVTAETVAGMFENLAIPSRYGDLLGAVGRYAINLETSVVPAAVLLVLHRLTRRAGPRAGWSPATVTAAATLSLVLIWYMAVYLMFSLNVAVHVHTSLDRLLLHLWPAAVLTYFLAVRPGVAGDAATA